MSVPPRFRVNAPAVAHQIIDGEVIAINLESGDYYSLSRSAAVAWMCLERGAGTDELVDALLAQYEAPRAEVEAAVSGLLDRLRGESLIRDAAPNEPEADARPAFAHVRRDAPAIFEPPVFEKFSDLRDLLLLDPIHDVDERGWPHASR